MTKQQQYHQYQNNHGMMTFDEWEQDGRYDPTAEPSITNMDKLLELHTNCVNAIKSAKMNKDPDKRNAIIAECAEAEAAMLQFYDETDSLKIKIFPWN